MGQTLDVHRGKFHCSGLMEFKLVSHSSINLVSTSKRDNCSKGEYGGVKLMWIVEVKDKKCMRNVGVHIEVFNNIDFLSQT